MLSRPVLAQNECIMCHPSWVDGDIIAVENVKIDLKNYENDLSNIITTMSVAWFLNLFLVIGAILLLFNKEVTLRLENVLKAMKRVQKGKFDVDDILEEEHVKVSNKNEIERTFIALKEMSQGIKPVIDNVVEQSTNIVKNAAFASDKIEENSKNISEQNQELEIAKQYTDNILSMSSTLSNSLSNLTQESHRTIEDINCISKMAQHTKNLLKTPTASIMLIEDETESKNSFARNRITFDVDVLNIKRDDKKFSKIMNLFNEKFGEKASIYTQMSDFYLFELTPYSGRAVFGFGAAYNYKEGEFLPLMGG